MMMRIARSLGYRSVEQMQDDLPPQAIHEWIAFEMLENDNGTDNGKPVKA